MPPQPIEYQVTKKDIPPASILALYRALNWSSAKKPDQLVRALQNSDTLITAWDGQRLIGLGNAISDGHLVVYYPHTAVHPDYQRQGIGAEIIRMLRAKYDGFHQQVLVADADAVAFYEKCGFARAGNTQPMWIFDGDEHG